VAESRAKLAGAYRRWGEKVGRFPISYRLRGLWFARKFTSAGWLACAPGLPWPRVRNLGGTLTAGNCLFYSGVRLEVGQGGRLAIGSGTFLNRKKVESAVPIRKGDRLQVGKTVLELIK